MIRHAIFIPVKKNQISPCRSFLPTPKLFSIIHDGWTIGKITEFFNPFFHPAFFQAESLKISTPWLVLIIVERILSWVWFFSDITFFNHINLSTCCHYSFPPLMRKSLISRLKSFIAISPFPVIS